ALAFLDRVLRPRQPDGQPRMLGPRALLGRMFSVTAGLSVFLNNTPIVAMLIPRAPELAGRNGLAPSHLLIPLSFAAIVGGMLTLVGTSTNVIVHGLLLAEGLPGYAMFDFTWIGVPVVLLSLLYFVMLGHRLLPERPGGREGLGRQL